MNILWNTFLFFNIIQAEVVLACTSGHDENKRLLLNDPDVTSSRLSKVEKSIQDVISLTHQLNAQSSNMQTTIADLQAALLKETAKSSALETTIAQLQEQGSTYIRWGRTQCGGVNTDLIYSGFIAGQDHNTGASYLGGPANILCLPNNPELSNRTAPGNSILVGTEYENGNFFASGAQDEDAPCALCRSKNISSSVMIPGRKTCYDGWQMEYHGILASGAYNFRPSSFICIDNYPEFIQGGQDDKDGFVLYATSTKCGSLTCPPYGDKLAVNCVVCSK